MAAQGTARQTVSVVIPNHNHTRYLREAIESALAQATPPLEVIVVDDGSTDDCRTVVAEYGTAVRYIFQENQGLAGARNTGIRAAEGELVGFLDADDRWLPGFLSEMHELADGEPGASVYYCCAQAVDEQGQLLPQILGGPPIDPGAIHQKLVRANFIIPSTVVVRRAHVGAVGLFDSRLRSCEDWDLWLRMLPTARFVGSAATLVRYRVHDDSLSGNVGNMRRAAEAVIEKHFGPDDGHRDRYNDQKRRAYGGLYRYFALTAVQRERDWAAATEYLRRALVVDPTLSSDLDLYYELALGDQPVGRRGTPLGLQLSENAAHVRQLVLDLLEGAGGATLRSKRHRVQGTAYLGLGLVAYNTGDYGLARQFLLRAISHRPALCLDRVVAGDLARCCIGNTLASRLRRLRARQTASGKERTPASQCSPDVR